MILSNTAKELIRVWTQNELDACENVTKTINEMYVPSQAKKLLQERNLILIKAFEEIQEAINEEIIINTKF